MCKPHGVPGLYNVKHRKCHLVWSGSLTFKGDFAGQREVSGFSEPARVKESEGGWSGEETPWIGDRSHAQLEGTGAGC